jgi:hypothetical protein
MRRNFSAENDFAHRLSLSYIRVSRQNQRNFDTRASLRRIYAQKSGIHPTVTISSRLKQLKEEVPEIIKNSIRSNRFVVQETNANLPKSAHFLKESPSRRYEKFAKNLADDVASAVD